MTVSNFAFKVNSHLYAKDITIAKDGVEVLEKVAVGSGRQCSPRHHALSRPSFPELKWHPMTRRALFVLAMRLDPAVLSRIGIL